MSIWDVSSLLVLRGLTMALATVMLHSFALPSYRCPLSLLWRTLSSWLHIKNHDRLIYGMDEWIWNLTTHKSQRWGYCGRRFSQHRHHRSGKLNLSSQLATWVDVGVDVDVIETLLQACKHLAGREVEATSTPLVCSFWVATKWEKVQTWGLINLIYVAPFPPPQIHFMDGLVCSPGV